MRRGKKKKRDGGRKSTSKFAKLASLSSEKSGKSLRRPWGLQIIGRAKPSAALPFRLQRAVFYYYYYSAFAFETTRLSPVYLYFLINRGFGDGGVEKKKEGNSRFRLRFVRWEKPVVWRLCPSGGES